MKINLITKNKAIYFKIVVSRIINNRYRVIDNLGIYNIKNKYILINNYKLRKWISLGAILTKNINKLLIKFNKLSN